MGAKQLLWLVVLLACIGSILAIQMPPYRLYGAVTVNGKTLTQTDSNVITLTIDGKQYSSFKMGDVAADAYVLQVLMSDTREEGSAMPGDIARIFVDGKEALQSPVTIGEYGGTVKLDLSVNDETTTPPPVPQPIQSSPSSGGGSSHGSSATTTKPQTTETVVAPQKVVTQAKAPEPAAINEVAQTNVEPQGSAQTEADTTQTAEVKGPSLFQRIKGFLGFNKEATDAVVADANEVPQETSEPPQAKPLVGILIALVIVAVGMGIAYAIIFKRDEF
jgi:hypothetical protein